MERALMRLGVQLLEEELPEEAHIDGGLCKVAGQVVLYVSPAAPPWRRARVLQQALCRLPHHDIWLPPELRRLLADEDLVRDPDGLLQLKQDEGEQ
jgi:hypothetical protein